MTDLNTIHTDPKGIAADIREMGYPVELVDEPTEKQWCVAMPAPWNCNLAFKKEEHAHLWAERLQLILMMICCGGEQQGQGDLVAA